MTPRTLSEGQLRLALLDRQLLLERADLTIPDALDRIGGIQDQYAPSGYVGLWTRLSGFRRDDLTRALEDRSVIQASLLRDTIHLVSHATFWPWAIGTRATRRAWWLRVRKDVNEADAVARAERLRELLADGPRDLKELGPEWSGFVGTLGLWVDLVRVPPSGTWERRRADRIGLAEDWIGPPGATESEGLAELVQAYLRAFGPGAWSDIAAWAGVTATALKAAAADVVLIPYRDEAGRALVDLPGSSLPDLATPTPARFVPHWDALLLVHARRTQVLPEAYRPAIFSTRNPFSVGCVLVDGQVAATWSVRQGAIVVTELRPLTSVERDAVEEERSALEAFHR